MLKTTLALLALCLFCSCAEHFDGPVVTEYQSGRYRVVSIDVDDGYETFGVLMAELNQLDISPDSIVAIIPTLRTNAKSNRVESYEVILK